MLTDKQNRFCEEYLLDLNATQAAIRAGYSENSARSTASENLAKPEIQDKIASLRANLSSKLSLDAEWVINRLKQISDRCMQAEPVMVRDSEGQLVQSGEYKFDSSGANKATELIGKHLGFFEKDNEQSKPLVQITGLNVT